MGTSKKFNESVNRFKTKYEAIHEAQEISSDNYKSIKELEEASNKLVELENGVNFVNNSSLAILLTENEVEEFMRNKETVENCKKIYLGHDVLLTGEQERLIEQNKIELNIIPEYYYKDLEA